MDAALLPYRQWSAAVRGLLADPTSLLSRQLGSDGLALDRVLLYAVLDELRVANWQRTKNGTTGTNPPAPLNPRVQQREQQPKPTGRMTPEQKQAYLDSIAPLKEDDDSGH